MPLHSEASDLEVHTAMRYTFPTLAAARAFQSADANADLWCFAVVEQFGLEPSRLLQCRGFSGSSLSWNIIATNQHSVEDGQNIEAPSVIHWVFPNFAALYAPELWDAAHLYKMGFVQNPPTAVLLVNTDNPTWIAMSGTINPT